MAIAKFRDGMREAAHLLGESTMYTGEHVPHRVIYA